MDAIVARLSGPNFFPGSQIPDVTLVVEQEIENLDDLAVPQLVEKLTAVIEGADPIAASNGRRFLLGLASGQDPKRRARIVKSFLILKSSTDLHSQLITELVSLDPNVLKGLPAATKLRVEALLCKNAAIAKSPLYAELRNPAHALAAMVAGLGEDFVLSEYGAFAKKAILSIPTSPEFIRALKEAPTMLALLQEEYCSRAGHSSFPVANPFAKILPSIDAALADVSTGEDALRLLAFIVRAANYGAFDAIDLANNRFNALPCLKTKARAFSDADPEKAEDIVLRTGYAGRLAAFVEAYFAKPSRDPGEEE